MARFHRKKENALAIFRIWSANLSAVYSDSKYADFTPEDFYEEFKNSSDLQLFYPDGYLYLDHNVDIPTKKELKKKAKSWRLLVAAVMA